MDIKQHDSEVEERKNRMGQRRNRKGIFKIPWNKTAYQECTGHCKSNSNREVCSNKCLDKFKKRNISSKHYTSRN